MIAIEKSRKEDGKTGINQDSIFAQLLDSNLPLQELKSHRLMEEGVALIGAAIDTTKWSTVVTIFHVLQNPAVLTRLRQELDQAIPDPASLPPLPTLEKLPYFMACIEEGKPTATVHGSKKLFYVM